MRASTSAMLSIRRRRHSSTGWPSAPWNWRSACRRCASVSAKIRSARPSTAVRSMRPFSKARRVNSPGSAMRNPSRRSSAASVSAMTARPPCRCSSTMSSPVSLRGPGNQSANPSSSTDPSAGLRNFASEARRGSGSLPINVSRPNRAFGPDMRTTAMAAGGGPEDRAKIVARFSIAEAYGVT